MTSKNNGLALLIAKPPRDARICHQASASYFEEGNLQDALNQTLKAVDLGLQSGRINPWHVRQCARVLIEAKLPALALDLMERNKPYDPEHVLSLQKARALRMLQRNSDLLKVLDEAAKNTRDPAYKIQIENYSRGILTD